MPFQSEAKVLKNLRKEFSSVLEGLGRVQDISFILNSELDSQRLKDSLREEYPVLSDREIRTYDSELYRRLSQELGFRVVSDELLGFHLKSLRELSFGESLSHLHVMSLFFEAFIDPGIGEAAKDFISLQETNDFRRLMRSLDLGHRVFVEALEARIASPLILKLFSNLIDFDDDRGNYFFKRDIEALSPLLREKFSEGPHKILDFDSDLVWENQLELFGRTKTLDSFETIEFNNPIEEVRWVFHKLIDEPNSLILIPPGCGYEGLIYLYQREFFKNEVYHSRSLVKSKVLRSFDRIRFKLSGGMNYEHEKLYSNEENYSEQRFQNLNRLQYSFENIGTQKVSFLGFLELLDLKDLDEEEMAFFSEIHRNIPSSITNSCEQWLIQLENIYHSKKNLPKYETSLNLQYLHTTVFENYKKIYVLGWGEHLFRSKMTQVLSNQSIFAVENNLGLFKEQIQDSYARRFFADALVKDETIEKVVCYSRKSVAGASVDPGVFQQLLSKRTRDVLLPERNYSSDVLYESSEQLLARERTLLSATSLQKYEDCPRKFYLEYIIGLKDRISEEHFLSPLEEGNLFHDVLEKWIKSTSEEFEAFKSEVYKLALSEQDEFNLFKRDFVDEVSSKLWNFILEERDFVRSNQIEIVGLEQAFEFSGDKIFGENSLLSKYKFRGKIDRIDRSKEGELLVYDYKRGSSTISSLKGYQGKNLNPQLFLYSFAMENSHELDGAFKGFQFIDLSKGKRSGGFVLEDIDSSLVKERTSYSVVGKALYDEKKQLFVVRLEALLERLNRKEYAASPKSFTVCQSCSWKVPCRKSETFL